MLVQPQPLSAALTGFEGLSSTVEGLRSLLPSLDSTDAGDAVFDRVARIKPSTFPGLLINLSALRESATAAALKESPSIVALWDRPQVSVSEKRYCANAKEGRTCGHSTVDLVDNSVSFVPRSPEASDAAARAATRQGVFDTVAEVAILADQGGGAAGGAIDALRGRQAGVKLAVLSPADAGASADTSLSPDDRKWVAGYEPPASRVAVAVGA